MLAIIGWVFLAFVFWVVGAVLYAVFRDRHYYKDADKHMKMINEQFVRAVIKHEFPCDLTDEDAEVVKDTLAHFKGINDSEDKSEQTQFTVLLEEIYEAVEADQQGRYRACLAELAQCGAVILRMMCRVQGKIDALKMRQFYGEDVDCDGVG